jgi:hypothetical protein
MLLAHLPPAPAAPQQQAHILILYMQGSGQHTPGQLSVLCQLLINNRTETTSLL